MRKKKIKNGMLQLSFEPLLLGVKIDCPDSCIKFLHEIWDKDLFHLQEQVYVLFADDSGEIMCWRCMGTGSSAAVILDVKLLLSVCHMSMASKIMLAHNHPAGSLCPSDKDRELTRIVNASTRFIEVKLVDHIILSRNGYYSFSQNGELK